MSFTLSDLKTAAKQYLYEPTTDRRYSDTALTLHANTTLADLSLDVEFLKKTWSGTGADYISAKGTTPRFFELPRDYAGLDPERGLQINGYRRLPTSDSEIGMFQRKVVYEDFDPEGYGIEDYFSLEGDGVHWHFSQDFVMYDTDLTDNYGGIFWFSPNVAATDVITLSYFTVQTLSLATDKLYALDLMKNVIVFGMVYFAHVAAYNGGAITADVLDRSLARYEDYKARWKMKQAKMKRGSGPRRMKTAAQVYGGPFRRGY